MVKSMFKSCFPGKKELFRLLIVRAGKGTRSTEINHLSMLFFVDMPNPAETVKLAVFMEKTYPEYYKEYEAVLDMPLRLIREGAKQQESAAKLVITLLKSLCLDMS